MTSIRAEKISEVRDRADIVDVVGRTVRLAKKGHDLWGLCPFHAEKSPSFKVSPDKGLFHCFGCHAGGDVFGFVMRLESLEFPDAVRRLAREVGVELDERAETAAERSERERRRSLLDLNARAAKFFRRELERDAKAMAYLVEERALSMATIDRFQLGFAPAGWSALAETLASEQIDPRLGLELGLLAKADTGRIYDRFRGRLVFPIAAPGGDIVGFGARRADWIDAEAPKYVNSPESKIYDKSSVFYGLEAARDEIRRSRRAVLVEGYVDVLAFWQAGILQAIAACGTALSRKHAAILAKLGCAVTLVYDGDAAGEEATERATLALLSAGISVKIVCLPDGKDPDTFVKSVGADAANAAIDGAPSAIDFFLDAAQKTAGGGVAGATQAMTRIRPIVSAIQDPLERDVALAAAARALGLDARKLAGHLGRPAEPVAAKTAREDRVPSKKAEAVPRPPVVELALLEQILLDPEKTIAELESREALGAFTHVGLHAAIHAAIAAHRSGQPFDAARAIEIVASTGVGEATASQVREALMETRPRKDSASECVTRLLEKHKEASLRALRRRIEAENDPEVAEKLALEAKKLLASRA